jgi:hypothetical protein
MRAIKCESRNRAITFPRFLQSINEAHQFFGSVGDGDIVMFSLGTLFSEVVSECRVPMANIFSCIAKRKAQVSGATLLHPGILSWKLPYLQ